MKITFFSIILTILIFHFRSSNAACLIDGEANLLSTNQRIPLINDITTIEINPENEVSVETTTASTEVLITFPEVCVCCQKTGNRPKRCDD